ncbi:DUF3667 domain-containing protein [Permianibacter sp. IMCC34836]|uniref:DUF3667 domain-containing protein n=1 Tax=Permianibacter fluminis TaxID=2738515 RepID=UPI001557EC26|nr:DUF3667 domain-containing protein [Permianibacter fluminis]NQD36545.1 DUF3667 domain-containing protein [Permianibacter fluminis]
MARLDTRTVFSHALQTLLSFDGTWLRTIKELLLRPGALILAYHAGARDRYVNPVLLVIVSYTFYFLLCHWLGIDPFASVGGTHNMDQPVLTFITNYSGQLSVLTAYPAAMLMRRFWPGTTTAERYVALLYVQSLSGFTSIALALVTALGIGYGTSVSYLLSFAAAIYAFAGVRQPWWKGALTGVAASLCYLVVVFGVAFVVGIVGVLVFGLGKPA